MELPGDANATGHNAKTYGFVNTNHYHHWALTITGEDMTVSVDGQQYGTVNLNQADSGAIILRVWNARLYVRNVIISRLGPQDTGHRAKDHAGPGWGFTS